MDNERWPRHGVLLLIEAGVFVGAGLLLSSPNAMMAGGGPLLIGVVALFALSLVSTPLVAVIQPDGWVTMVLTHGLAVVVALVLAVVLAATLS